MDLVSCFYLGNGFLCAFSLQVLITIYWLGRRAQCDRFYNGPYLNFKAFEGLLGTALYKVNSSKMGNYITRAL